MHYAAKIIGLALLLPFLFVGCATDRDDRITSWEFQWTAPHLDTWVKSMPADSVEKRNEACAGILTWGQSGITGLCKSLLPPGTGDDVAIRFAINGVAKYAARPGARKQRRIVSNGIGKALAACTNPDVARFLMQNLEVVGGNESVRILAPLLDGDATAESAAMALRAIGTSKAANALTEALDHADVPQQAMLVKHLGELRHGAALGAIAERATHADAALRNASLNALAAMGDPASEPVLLESQKGGTPYEYLVAHARYLRYIDQVDDQSFSRVFNGRNLRGWMGDTEGYSVIDHAIVCKPGGNLYTTGEYSDFVFRFEFRLPPGGNNGLAVRAPGEGNAAYNGLELQILDNTADQYKALKPYQYHGSVYGIKPAKRGYLKPVGQWNHETVIARGRQITVILNGTVIVDTDLDEAVAQGTMDKQEHPGLARTRGHLGFLGHGDPVRFRNIRILELKS